VDHPDGEAAKAGRPVPWLEIAGACVTIKGMLIPRFTIRGLLLLTFGGSLLSLVFSFAVRGQLWAIAVSLAVAGTLIAFLLYGVLFGLAYLLASMAGRAVPRAKASSPFAAGPPPQILPPREPEQL
jgi:hypothetical protein